MNITLGKITAHCGDTRTESDFSQFMSKLIKENSGFKVYHIVLDQLNTHKSETLVRFVATFCGIDKELGIKGKWNTQVNGNKRTVFS